MRYIGGGHINVNGRYVRLPVVPFDEWVEARVDDLVEAGADEIEARDVAELNANTILELQGQGRRP